MFFKGASNIKSSRLKEVYFPNQVGFFMHLSECYSQGFFKRSLKKKATYTCAHDGKCDTKASKRTVCNACRLKKCTEVGMSKSGEADVKLHACVYKYDFISWAFQVGKPHYIHQPTLRKF